MFSSMLNCQDASGSLHPQRVLQTNQSALADSEKCLGLFEKVGCLNTPVFEGGTTVSLMAENPHDGS